MNEQTEEVSTLSEQEADEIVFDYLENENTNKIKEMMSQDIKIWEFKSKNNDNSTVLHVSVFKKLFTLVELIIDYCKKKNKEGLAKFINQKNNLGATAIHYASFRGNINIIKLLVENGANIYERTERNLNVIHYSCQGNKPSALMYFYLKFNKEEDYKLLTEKDKGGSTALHWAAYTSSEDALLFLINLDYFNNDEEKRKNFIDSQDSQGLTPLHLSISSKSSRIVLKLLQNGASSDIEDKKGKTPLALAIEKKQRDIAIIIKNNQSCQFCNVKAPVKQIKKSIKNILIVSLFQILTTFLLFGFIISIAFGTSEEENNGNNLYNVLFIIYLVLLLLFFIFYILLICMEPGEKPKNSIEFLKELLDKNEDLTKYCYKCFVKKSKTLKHCIICDKCYEDFDHHCYWINKCVAKNNYKLFIAFLFETFFYLSMVLIISIFGLIHLITDDHDLDFYFFGNKVPLKIVEELFNISDKKFVFYICNILVIVIDLFFLIPEFLLLCLHLNVCFYNYKLNKRNNSMRKDSSVIETPLIDSSSEMSSSNIN
jgi:palmitoyltransferase